MSTPKTTKPVAPVIEAQKRATIPKRQVIQHNKLFRAGLELQRSAAQDALNSVDHALASAAGERDLEREAADHARDLAVAFADQKFDTIRTELDAERDDIKRTLGGIEAALSATAPEQPSNVISIAAE